MEIIILWISSIIISIVLEIKNELRIFKDVADNGYKIDINRLDEISKQINPNATKATLYSLLLPFLNLKGVCERTIQYNNIRPFILDQLSVLDSLIPMTKEEEKKYNEKPSSINALAVSVISLINGKNIINEQKDKVNEINTEIEESIEEIVLLEELSTLLINDKNEDNILVKENPLSIEEQKKQLEDLKDYVISTQINNEEEQKVHNTDMKKKYSNKN